MPLRFTYWGFKRPFVTVSWQRQYSAYDGLKVDMLTILIGLKQTKQIETYLFFPEFARQRRSTVQSPEFERETNICNEDFPPVLVNMRCQEYDPVSIQVHDLVIYWRESKLHLVYSNFSKTLVHDLKLNLAWCVFNWKQNLRIRSSSKYTPLNSFSALVKSVFNDSRQ